MKNITINKPNVLVYDISKTIKSVAIDISIGTKVNTNDEAEVIQADSKEELITLSKSLELHSDKEMFKEYSI